MEAASRPLRVGAVSFLNTVPLLPGLDDDPAIDLRLDLPARLADELYEGRLDVGLVPAVEYLRGVGGDIVPGICISSHGPVHSVKVLSRVPLDEADRIAVDRGSRSSIALLRILLAERFDRHPDLEVVEPQLEDLFAAADSILVIGDRALSAPEVPFTYDLGTLWRELTGLPFVYAMWVLSRDLSRPEEAVRRRWLMARLQRARDEGRRDLQGLAAAVADRRGLRAADVHRYWTHHVRFDLGPAELAGLDRFAALAHRHHLCHGREQVTLAQA